MNTVKLSPSLTLLKTSSPQSLNTFDRFPKSTLTSINIPDTFNSPKLWKKYLSPIKNQGACGSCWAFATTSSLADRFNLCSKGVLHLELSPTKLILCDFQGMEWGLDHPEIDQDLISKLDSDIINQGACRGNTLMDAWKFLYVKGTTTEQCIPYNQKILAGYSFKALSDFSKVQNLPFCTSVSGLLGDMCSDFAENKITGDEYGTPARFYRCIHYYTLPNDERKIREDIYKWGPVSTGMDVYPDFYSFDPTSDIYDWNGKGEVIGGHAISFVGWGEEGGVPYWIVRNSWGKKWGRGGFFYMKRGVNCCKTEENVIAGLPDLFVGKGYPSDLSLPSVGYAKGLGIDWSGEDPIVKAQRFSMDTDVKMPAGGIDPEHGYSRRVITEKPWLDLKPVVSSGLLPDFQTFLAGEEGGQSNNKKRSRISIWVWIAVGITILSVIGVIWRIWVWIAVGITILSVIGVILSIKRI